MLLEEEDPQDHGIFFILITRGRKTRKRRLTMGRGCGQRFAHMRGFLFGGWSSNDSARVHSPQQKCCVVVYVVVISQSSSVLL